MPYTSVPDLEVTHGIALLMLQPSALAPSQFGRPLWRRSVQPHEKQVGCNGATLTGLRYPRLYSVTHDFTLKLRELKKKSFFSDGG